MDPRLLFWALFRPIANMLIAAATLFINYYGLRLIFARLGLDFDSFVTSYWFIGGLLLAWAILAVKTSPLDALLNVLDELLGYNFTLGLVMSPWLGYLFWGTNGWQFLAFWIVSVVWLSVGVAFRIRA